MQKIKLETGLILNYWECPESTTCVFLMHGMAEHFGRYEELIDILRDNGISAAGFHYPGHGENTPLGVMEPEMIEIVIRSVNESYEWLRSNGVNRLIHFAHSMGTFFTRILMDQLDCDHVILSGAAHVEPRKLDRMAPVLRFLTAVLNHNRTHRWLVDLVFSDFLKPYGETGNKRVFISSKRHEQQRYIDDPLCGFPISIGFVCMLAELSRLTDLVESQRMSLDLPVTFMSGKEDSVGDMGKAIVRLGEKYRQINQKESHVLLFDGRHEVLNDTGHQIMKEEILAIC